MCREHRGLIAFASLLGLLQSALWVAVTTVLILIYYCVIEIDDYEKKSDFFLVTLVKLYFEGPKCTLDGTYLGKFNEEYKNITLIGREVMMFVLIAYVILSAIYFIISMLLYLKRRRPKKRLFTTAWSVITLILCGLDFLITYCLVIDSLNLMDYFAETPDLHDVLLGTIPYIPLLLSFVSSRFVIIWIWNFFIGIYVLFIGLCGGTVPEPKVQEVSTINLKVEDKTGDDAVENMTERTEEKPKAVLDGRQRLIEDRDGSLSLISENFRTSFASDRARAHPEYNAYMRSMEAVTKFSDADRIPREYHPYAWCYEPPSEMPPYMKPHPQVWRMPETRLGETNEGYLDDEEVTGRFDRDVDFRHNLKNFESGQKKIKIMRPHTGKPVGIPVPPPLPPVESCNC